MSKRLLFIVIAALAIVATACGGSSKDKVDAQSDPTTSTPATTEPGATVPSPGATTPDTGPTSTTGLPTVKLATSEGDIVLEMDTKNAPKAAGRFIKLVKDGFYDGLTFHRVVPDFVIQGGDPAGNGSGGTDESVVGETPTDGYPIGSIAAAKTGADPAGTFDCQFFIVTGVQGESLPPDYARFGKVISGIEVAKKIEGLSPGGDGPPSKKATINKATVTE